MLFAVVAVSLWASVALAEGVSIGPRIGFSKASDSDAKVLYGAALRLHLLPAVAVEGSIDYRQDDMEGHAGEIRSWPLQVTGLLYPLPIVYGAIGAGWYNTTFDFKDTLPLEDDTQQEFGWHFGGGLDLPLGDVASLAVDVRYVYLDYEFDSIPGSAREDDSTWYGRAPLQP
jgi:outer membrane protein W